MREPALPVSSASRPLVLFVMGVSGCGKSTVGRLLAGRLGCPFLEGDDYHSDAAVAKMKGGDPLTDADRWPWLDRLGHAAASAAQSHGTAIAACSALRRSYRDRLRAIVGAPAHFLFLDSRRDELLARLTHRTGHYMPASLLDSQLATLEPPAPEESALTLCATASPPALCDSALRWVEDMAARAPGI
jgi:gluconokinase